MKIQTYTWIIVLVICILFLTGHTMAVRPSQANYGDNIVKSTVDAFCIGTFTVDHKMQWSQTSDENGSLKTSPLKEGESRTDYTYRENTLGYEGTATYIKDFSMNGGNVQQGIDNLNINHIIDFEANPEKTGLLHFEEQAIMNVAGAAGGDSGTPICIFASGGSGEGAFTGTVTVGSQMDVREVSARTSIGSAGISADSDMPVNLRYAFDAEGLATDPKDNLGEGSARTYSSVDMHTYDNTYDLNYSAPNLTGHFRDSQDLTWNGLLDIATTFEYGT